MKRVLMLATVPSMIGQFNMSNIKILQDMECKVYVACNFDDNSVWNYERISEFKEELKTHEIIWHQVDFQRNAFKILKNHSSYKQILDILKKDEIDCIHCHTPVGGLIGRLAAYRCQVKVVYTAHGFHFYDGAKLLNWILYYPIEKILSYITDILITINVEDYERAKKQLHAKQTEYIPGVGVNVEYFESQNINLGLKREELELPISSVVLLSVGELNKNKNHITIIKALDSLKAEPFFPVLKYIICGQGEDKKKLEEMVNTFHLEQTVRFLGFRRDVNEIYKIADIFIFPSFREGLSVALMEAMANGLPVIGSKIRGNIDLIKQEEGGYLTNPSNFIEFGEYIKKLTLQNQLKLNMGQFNLKKINQFSSKTVYQKMVNIYKDIIM